VTRVWKASPARIAALHVGRGVRLRVPERLRLLQRLAEAGTGGVHPVQDEVRGAVDDAEHPVHGVAGQRLAQRPQQRDRPRHRGLVIQVGADGTGSGVDLLAVLGEQRLVRGDHGLAGLHRGQQQRAGRLDAADYLDDDVHVRPGGQPHGVGRQQPRVDARPRVRQPPHRDPGQFEPRPGAHREVVGLLPQQPRHLRPDDPAAEQRHPQRPFARFLKEFRRIRCH
jgi:hypothetical protein